MSSILLTVEEFAPLVVAFLQTLASAPASSSFLTPQLDSLLSSGAALVAQGSAGAAALAELTGQIKAMVAANRDPTPEEWATLKARSDAAHTIISGVKP